MDEKRDRVLGCLLGGAVGDALGYPVEFLSEPEILRQYGPAGIKALAQAGSPARVSDDTQMTLFAANAWIYGCSGEGWDISTAWLAYREWLGTQGDESRMGKPRMWIYGDRRLHARRAPGNTCLSAIRFSDRGGTMKNPVNNSKGCGTVMRAAPYGLMPGSREAAMERAAADAALTHGHPLAWGSSAWLAACVHALVEGAGPLADRVADIKLPQRLNPDGTLLALVQKAIALANREDVTDLEAIHALGEGWVAEEALAIALFCALRHRDDFAAALRAAVNHKGDSDSTGAICGNILGAFLGAEAVAKAFDLEQLELKDIIQPLSLDLLRTHTATPIPGQDPAWDQKYRF